MVTNSNSILEMAKGAIMEQVNVETSKVVQNILDPNTAPTKKRKITLTVEFTPSADRQKVGIKAIAKSTLEPNNAIETALYVGADSTGTISAMEMTPNIPGQITLDGDEEDSPKVITFGGRTAVNQ
ncbi:MAG: hypothetical protein J6D27_03500 [Ruminiclostridium sp.]|nr:hypothetical protein [Ruminiclostridium sp.]